ncbi:hypothetical protein A2U01_0091121, partial [Trifolium medium]|nr:hypothetical protein [Trifolium medium]
LTMTHLLILRHPVLTAVTTTTVAKAESMAEANVDEAEDVVEVVLRNNSGHHRITCINNGLICRI